MKNPAEKVEAWPIDKLIPYAKNSRTHSDDQVAQIAASMKEWGITSAILVDEEGGIIAGHGRVLAARKLGKKELPVMVAEGWTEAQKRAYVIADNKLALNAGWDIELLALELGELGDLGFDLDLTGFSDEEIAGLIPEQIPEGLTDEDDVPEVEENPITVPGDIWVLGNHRLMCGDSTSIDAMDALVENGKADLIFTDPPYGMGYKGGRGKKQFGMIKGDDASGTDLIRLVQDALIAAKTKSKQGAPLYVCFPWRTYAEFQNALNLCGFEINACIVWDKKSVGLSDQDYRPQHEFIFYSKGEQFYGDRTQSDVWHMSRGSTSSYVHPTQKPVELVEKAIRNSSKSGDIVIDCFGGSGSALIASEKTARSARIMELDPKYCDVIIKRWQEFTGKQAVHAETGKTFEEVKNASRPS